MTTSVSGAGPAAPEPAAAELPTASASLAKHALAIDEDTQITIEARAPWWSRIGKFEVPACAWLDVEAGPFRLHLSTDPATLRQLAVYLVDCANALDNPAQRVIVDEGEGLGHE